MYNNLSHQSHNIYRKHSARISFFCVVEKDMPFVIPYYKKPAKLRERYKTVETYQAFDLQVLKRGKPSISRPLCRILVRAFDRTFIRRQHSRSHSKRSRICYRMFRRRSGKSRGQSSRVRRALVRKYNSRPPYDNTNRFRAKEWNYCTKKFPKMVPRNVRSRLPRTLEHTSHSDDRYRWISRLSIDTVLLILSSWELTTRIRIPGI